MYGFHNHVIMPKKVVFFIVPDVFMELIRCIDFDQILLFYSYFCRHSSFCFSMISNFT